MVTGKFVVSVEIGEEKMNSNNVNNVNDISLAFSVVCCKALVLVGGELQK